MSVTVISSCEGPNDTYNWLKVTIEKEFRNTIDLAVSKCISTIKDQVSSERLGDDIARSIWRSEEMGDFRDRVKIMFAKMNARGHNDSVCFINKRGMHTLKEDNAIAALYSNPTIRVVSNNRDNEQSKVIESSGWLEQNILQNYPRIQAIELLLRTPLSDVIYNSAWPQLQQELCEGLCEDNMELFSLVLRVHSRLLSSALYTPSKEGFFSLLEGLTLFYLTLKTYASLPTVYTGIDLNNSVHKKMICITKCAIEAICEFPKRWVRFGEKRVQEILENIIDLLSMHTHNSRSLLTDMYGSVLYPFHLISVLDPKASWCNAIMHASFGRTIFLKLLIKSPSLLQFVLEEILVWLNQQIRPSHAVMFVYDDYFLGHNISGTMIASLVFMHSLCIIKILVCSDRGHYIFPTQTTLEEDPVTVYSLILKILSFLNAYKKSKLVVYCEQFLDFIEETVTELILSKGTKILLGKSCQLVQLLVETTFNFDKPALHPHNIKILNRMSDTESGINWILGRPEKRFRDFNFKSVGDFQQAHPSSAPASRGEISRVSCQFPCIPVTVIDGTVSALKDRQNLFQSQKACSYVCQMISLCAKLFGTVDGFLILDGYENHLVSEAGNLFLYLCNNSVNRGPNKDILTLCLSLEDLFLKLAMTPLGFVSISNVDGLVNCLVMSHLNHPLKAWDSPSFMHFMELTLLLTDKGLNIHRHKLISNILNDLWSVIKDENNFLTMDEQVRQNIVNYFLSRLLSLCSTAEVLSELLSDDAQDSSRSDSSEGTLVDETQHSNEPLSLHDLFTAGLEQENPPHVYHICHVSLHALCQYFDTSVILIEKLNLQEQLARLRVENSLGPITARARYSSAASCDSQQPSPRRDQNENTMFPGNILEVFSQVPNCCTSSFLYIPMSCNLTSPRAQIRTARLRTQTDLQRFLQDTRQGLHDSTWLSHARRVYRVSCNNDMKVCVLLDLLDQVIRCQNSSVLFPSWPSVTVNRLKVNNFTNASQLVVRYGCQQKVLNPHMSTLYVEQLLLLLYQSHIYLLPTKEQTRFDWFVASVFLMCSGNIDRSRSILQRIAMLHTGPLLWPCLSQCPWQSSALVSHQLQGLISEFLPQEYNIFQTEGIPWWHTMMRLTQQGFLPVIPISQMPHLVAFYALHSSDYIGYLMTSMLAHIKSRRTKPWRFGSIQCLLTELQTDSFSVSDLLPFTDRLSKLNRPPAAREKSNISTL